MRAIENEQADLSLALLGRIRSLLRLPNGGLQHLRAALIKRASDPFRKPPHFSHFRPKLTTPQAEKCS